MCHVILGSGGAENTWRTLCLHGTDVLVRKTEEIKQ